MKQALSLLEKPKGPVLVDYPHDCKETNDDPGPATCPVNFIVKTVEQSDQKNLLNHIHSEINTMKTWYDIAREKRGRSTAELSGLTPDQIVELFSDFIKGKEVVTETKDQNLSDFLRFASEDLKAFYLEALSAQPGQATGVNVLADWFWGETYAAILINEVRKSCLKKETKGMKVAGNLLLIPRNQMHRFEKM